MSDTSRTVSHSAPHQVPSHIAVVGGGLAAVSVITALREHGYEGRIHLLADELHLPYDRPPLSKEVLAGELDPADAVLQPEQWYSEHDIDVRLGCPALALRPSEGVLELPAGEFLHAAAVVLATGGLPRRLDVPGISDPRVFTLRTRDDAEQIRAALQNGTRLLVVGAGLIGAEVTAAAVQAGCQVTLIDPVPLPLSAIVGHDVALFLHGQHRNHGVALVQGTIRTVAGSAGDVLRVTVEGPQIGSAELEADVMVVGIGSLPNVTLAESAGVKVDGGILVDEHQRSSHPQIYAAGDVARPARDGIPGRREEHWDAARRQGEAVAASLLGLPLPAPTAPWFWSDRYGVRLEVVGAPAAGTPAVVRGSIAEGSASVIHLHQGRVVAAVCLGRPAEARALRRLLDRAEPVDGAALAEEAVDLRQLANA